MVIDLFILVMLFVVVDYVVVVVFFGELFSGFFSMLWGGGLLLIIGLLYSFKIINLCVFDDLICIGGGNIMVYVLYV